MTNRSDYSPGTTAFWIGVGGPTSPTYVLRDTAAVARFDRKVPDSLSWVMRTSLGDLSTDTDPTYANQIDADADGRPIPPDFRHVLGDAALHDVVARVSPTGCWFDQGVRVDDILEPGDVGWCFYRDQQDVVFWYVYVDSGGEWSVIASWDDLEDLADSRSDRTPLAAALSIEVYRVAMTMSSFIGRIWGESMAHAIVSGTDAVTTDMRSDTDVIDYARILDRRGGRGDESQELL